MASCASRGSHEFYSQNFLGRPYFAPLGVRPRPDRGSAQALRATLAARALLADAQMSGLEVDPTGGDELQAMVSKLYAQPPETVARAKRALINKPPAR